ncbi:MAG TPA: ABC transporter ATP-binding protein [Solirubrobacterales bacterium]|nr:ABC transporter ATP-binding protein [Solirubrobacterales bacterium]
MSDTLAMEGVGKHYRGLAALADVSLSVAPGEVVGLIGPNGSGKTTLLGIASGVLKPSAGRVKVGATDATGAAAARFARLGVGRTFQQVRLFEGFTVTETVALGAIAKGLPVDERIDDQLRRFGLAGHRDRLGLELAYGLQRRVEIARAMAGRPRFLLLDEPAAGMNEAETEDLLGALRQVVSDSGCGVLIVDHDLHLILQICDRVHVLNDGVTLAEGDPEAVRRDPRVVDAYIGTFDQKGHH